MKTIQRLTIGLLLMLALVFGAAAAAWGETFLPYGDQGNQVLDESYKDRLMVRARDGGFFLTSPANKDRSDDCQIRITKVDKTGKVTWSQLLLPSGRRTVGLVYPTSDSGLLVIFQADQALTEPAADLLKLDSKGAITWERNFAGCRINSVHECNDKGYVFAGSLVTGGRSRVLVLKTDKYGRSDTDSVYKWEKTFGDADGQEAYHIVQVLDEDDYNDGYIVTGFARHGGTKSALLLRLDAYGAEDWSREFGGSENAEATFALPVKEENGDEISGFMVVGYKEDSSGNKRIYLLRTDEVGNKEQWQERDNNYVGSSEKTFGGDNKDLIGIALYEVPDEFKDDRVTRGKSVMGYGGFMLVGLDKSGSADNELHLVRINEKGKMMWESNEDLRGKTLQPANPDQDNEYRELLYSYAIRSTQEDRQQLDYYTMKIYLAGDTEDDKTLPPEEETNSETWAWTTETIWVIQNEEQARNIKDLLAATQFPPLSEEVLSANSGTIRWPDTSFYKGDLSAGRADGSGYLVFPDGTRYKGEWKDNMFSGEGDLYFPTGEHYTGSFREHMMYGTGTYTWPSGERYEGGFSYNKRSGEGIFTWPGGVTYKGGFVNDKPQGKGSITWSNGERYDGEMKDGNATGWGVYTFPSGDHYEGDLVNMVFTGFGRYYWSYGAMYVGQFKNDRFNGEGIYVWPNGVKQWGYWKDNRYMGTNPGSIK